MKQVKVTVWQTADDRQFLTKEEAAEHELHIQVAKWVEARGYNHMDKDDIVSMIMANRSELRAILQDNRLSARRTSA